MSTPLRSDAPTLPGKSFETVSLVISLSAAPSARLTHEISVVLNHRFQSPYTFLGSIDDALNLELRLSDLGQTATEALAKRLLKLKGVKKLKAERVCPRRGAIYAISLRSLSR